MLSDVNVSSNCNRFTINHERQRCGLLSNDFDHLFNWYSFLKLLQVGTHPKTESFGQLKQVSLQTRRPSRCSSNSVKEKKETVSDRVKVLCPTWHKIGHFGHILQVKAWYGKLNLTQQKHTFTKQKKRTTTQKKLKPGLVAFYVIRRTYSGFGAS